MLITVTSCGGRSSLKSTAEIQTHNTIPDVQMKDTASDSPELVSKTTLPKDYKSNDVEKSPVGDPNNLDTKDMISNAALDSFDKYVESLKYAEDIEAKISLAVTTVDLVTATGNALNAWDAELNRIYLLLIDTLSDEEIEKLRTEERLWIKVRDSEADEYAAKFEGGSFSTVAYNEILMQKTKERTLELIQRYYNCIKTESPLVNNQLDKDLCAYNENVVVSFKIQNSDKRVTICAADDNGYIVFRLGSSEKVDVEYPADKTSSWELFTYSYYLRGGIANAGLDSNNLHFEDETNIYWMIQEYSADDDTTTYSLTVTDKLTKKEIQYDAVKDSAIGDVRMLRDNINVKTLN